MISFRGALKAATVSVAWMLHQEKIIFGAQKNSAILLHIYFNKGVANGNE